MIPIFSTVRSQTETLGTCRWNHMDGCPKKDYYPYSYTTSSQDSMENIYNEMLNRIRNEEENNCVAVKNYDWGYYTKDNDDWRYGKKDDDWKYYTKGNDGWKDGDDWKYYIKENDDWKYGKKDDDWKYYTKGNDDWKYGKKDDDWKYYTKGYDGWKDDDDWKYDTKGNDDWKYGKKDEDWKYNKKGYDGWKRDKKNDYDKGVEAEAGKLKEHQSFLSKTTVSEVSDLVPQLISMKENISNCVPKSGKCVTKITLD